MLWGSQPERRLFSFSGDMVLIMTDQHLIQRGKQITDFQEAKNKMVDLRTQAREISKRLSAISQAIQADPLSNGGLDTLVEGLPTKTEVLHLIADVRTAQKTIADVQKAMRQIDIEIS